MVQRLEFYSFTSGTERFKELEDFSRLDEVVNSVNLIPQLYSLYKNRNLNPTFYIFNAIEASHALSNPVRTRIILPILSDLSHTLGKKQTPGLGFYELLGSNDRSIGIDINLTEVVLKKLRLRYAGYFKSLSDTRTGNIRPGWWPITAPIVNMTRPQDLVGLKKYWRVPKFLNVEPLDYINSYLWDLDKTIIPYETELYDKEKTISHWLNQSKAIDIAWQNADTLLQAD